MVTSGYECEHYVMSSPHHIDWRYLNDLYWLLSTGFTCVCKYQMRIDWIDATSHTQQTSPKLHCGNLEGSSGHCTTSPKKISYQHRFQCQNIKIEVSTWFPTVNSAVVMTRRSSDLSTDLVHHHPEQFQHLFSPETDPVNIERGSVLESLKDEYLIELK